MLWVTGAALQYLGFSEARATLAAVSGAAFRLPGPSCRGCPAPPELDMRMALAAVGLSQALVLRDAGGLDPEHLQQIVAQETATGRPVALRGWPPAGADWSLLAGCAPGGLLCGYGPDSRAGDPYRAAPAEGSEVVRLGPWEPVPAAELLTTAIRAARQCWEEELPGCATLYRTWLHLLSEEAGATPALAREAAGALTALAENRMLARDFLEAQVPDLEVPLASAAQRALGLYDQMLDCLEPLSEALSAPEGDLLWTDPDWRVAARARLAEVAELDAEAVNCLRRGGEAEYALED